MKIHKRGYKMKKIKMLILFVASVLILTGCMYPTAEKKELETADELNLTIVQKAVDQYRQATNGLLPIKTRDEKTDKYIKYPIDFEMLTQGGYLDKLPTNSFEKGGIFQYVIWKAESDQPEVKVVDLQQAEAIREVSIVKGINGFVKIGDNIHGNVYEINYKKMGMSSQPSVPSPYSATVLPLVIKGTGEICVDYSIELQKIINEEQPKVKKGKDIRYLLEEKYSILPAYSLAYVLNDNGEVEFLDDLKNK